MSTTTAAMPVRGLVNGWDVCRETPVESGRRIVLAVNPQGGDQPYATMVETWGALSAPRYFVTRSEAEADYADRAFRDV